MRAGEQRHVPELFRLVLALLGKTARFRHSPNVSPANDSIMSVIAGGVNLPCAAGLQSLKISLLAGVFGAALNTATEACVRVGADQHQGCVVARKAPGFRKAPSEQVVKRIRCSSRQRQTFFA